MEGVLSSVGDKKEWGECQLFPVFSGKLGDCINWYKPQERCVSLAICVLLDITCITTITGVLFGIFCFPSIFKCYKPFITSTSFPGGEAMGCDR